MIKKKFFLQVVIFVFLSSLVFSQENIKEVRILHWNDFHAHDLPYKISKKDSVTGGDLSYFVGGTSDMLGYLNKYRDGNTLVMNGGDDYQGTPISNFTRGFSQIELLNLYNLDAFVIGNHDFDYGQFALDSALQLANFDYLSANVFFKPKNTTMGKPYVIKNINGVKVGIIGLTAFDLKTLVLPKNISETEMLNTDSVIAVNIQKLKDEKCNLIVLLTHIGVSNDKKIAEKFFKDIDIIIGGHSHTPLFKPIIQNGVIICQAGFYSRWIGKLDLKIDVDKDTVVDFRGELIETKMDSSIYDKDAQQKVEGMMTSIQGDLMKVIGTLKQDWKREFSKESNIGQWEADAFRAKTRTDIAFLNSGGIRKDLPKGDITINDIWEINPFGNTIVTFNVTGKTLKEMMSNSLKKRTDEINELGSSDMVVVSGLEVTYDSKKALNNEKDFIVNMKVGGKDIDSNKIYSVTTSNYVSGQFKKYFGEVSEGIKIFDTSIIDRDLIIEAIEKQKQIDSQLEHRIIDVSNQEIKN